jgi:hypothetical protein
MAAFALLMLAIFFASFQMEYLDAKLIPMIVSAVGFFLAAIEIGREILRKEAPSAITETEQAQEKPKRLHLRYLYEGSWLAGFGLAIYLVGFLAAIPLFTISYLKLHGRRWLPSVTVAAVMTLVLYGLLTYLFGIDLYPGLIPELLGG